MAYQVGKDEHTGEQVTIDWESRRILEGVVEDGIVALQSGLRLVVKNGYVIGEA